MNTVYEQKYLKYKKKYLELKKQQEAGYVGFQSVGAMFSAATSKMGKITAESYEKHFGTPEQKAAIQKKHEEAVANAPKLTKEQLLEKKCHDPKAPFISKLTALEFLNLKKECNPPPTNDTEAIILQQWAFDKNCFFYYAGYEKATFNEPKDGLPEGNDTFSSDPNKYFGPITIEDFGNDERKEEDKRRVHYPKITLDDIKNNYGKYIKFVVKDSGNQYDPENDPFANQFMGYWNMFTESEIAKQGVEVGFADFRENLEYQDDVIHTATLQSRKFPDVNFLFFKSSATIAGNSIAIITILIKPLENNGVNNDGNRYPFWPLNDSKIDNQVYTPDALLHVTQNGITVDFNTADILFRHAQPPDNPNSVSDKVVTKVNFDNSAYNVFYNHGFATFYRITLYSELNKK